MFELRHSDRSFVSVDFVEGSSGSVYWALLRSDVHHDHVDCDQELERKHLDQAKERGAVIVDNGDLFCAMQGKFDRRSDKSCIREEYKHGDYLDRLVTVAADFYGPYAKNFAVISMGNHERSIRDRHETDLTDRLVQLLNSRHGSNIQSGGYSGYVRFSFRRKNHRMSRLLKRYHGTGGGGPVTRGVIQTNRMAVIYPDADFVLSGHTHDEWVVPIQRERVTGRGRVVCRPQIHIRVPGYKDAWKDGTSGWEVERMLGPKPIGAKWLRFELTADDVICEVLDAK
ncbi:MAG: hypothetical protein KatS3mg104_3068 [Phycisphaerae bacterium]|nr:MAG: hypothetical protein KatS3mg104_3068 [Phycisphaerae bacterium]